jgi:hypothetical protein
MNNIIGVVAVAFFWSALMSSTSGVSSKEWDDLSKRLSKASPLPGVPSSMSAECATTAVQGCVESGGSGSCGGYNRDDKKNCAPCTRPTTYKCDDGKYREFCKPDHACGSGCP